MTLRGFATVIAAAGMLIAGAAAPASAADGPAVLETGYTEGQLVGRHSEVRPVVSADVVRLQVLLDGKISQTHSVWSNGILRVDLAPIHQDKDVDLTIRGLDEDGNAGQATTRVHLDSQAAGLTFTPEPRSVVHGLTTIRFTPDVDDVAEIVMTSRNGTVLGRDTEAPWAIDFDFTGFDGGDAQFQARDRAGNQSTLYRAYYTVDTTGPVISKVTPAPFHLVRGTTATSTLTATDPSGFRRATMNVTAVAGVTAGPAATFTTAVPLGRDGHLNLNWTVVDQAGNTSRTATSLVVDNTRPAITKVTAPANGAKVGSMVTTSMTATDTNGIREVQVWINGKLTHSDAKAPYAINISTAAYGKSFTVAFYAVDKAGNVASTSRRTWKR